MENEIRGERMSSMVQGQVGLPTHPEMVVHEGHVAMHEGAFICSAIHDHPQRVFSLMQEFQHPAVIALRSTGGERIKLGDNKIRSHLETGKKRAWLSGRGERYEKAAAQGLTQGECECWMNLYLPIDTFERIRDPASVRRGLRSSTFVSRTEMQASVDSGLRAQGCCTKHSPLLRSQAGWALRTMDSTCTLLFSRVCKESGSVTPGTPQR